MPDIRDLLEGKFARVGISLVNGAVVTFLNEGKREENSFDNDDDADERLTIQVEINGEKKLVSPNMTSMRELAKAWGTNTKSWVGKKAKVTIEEKRVFGSVKKVAFFHPVARGAQSELGLDIDGTNGSPEVQEIILELEACQTRDQFISELGLLSDRVNKLSPGDKKVFAREKTNIENRL